MVIKPNVIGISSIITLPSTDDSVFLYPSSSFFDALSESLG